MKSVADIVYQCSRCEPISGSRNFQLKSNNEYYTQAALAAVSALAKEHPGLTSLEAAAYALGFVEGKECEDTRVPEASEDFYKHLNKEWLEVRYGFSSQRTTSAS